MNQKLVRATCLPCGKVSEDDFEIESINWYGECLACQESFFRWDFENGEILITNGKTDQEIRWTSEQEWK